MDLVTPLKAYIDVRFAGRDAADAAEDLAVIQGLRAEVVANALVSPDARRELLLRYVAPPSLPLPSVCTTREALWPCVALHVSWAPH